MCGPGCRVQAWGKKETEHHLAHTPPNGAHCPQKSSAHALTSGVLLEQGKQGVPESLQGKMGESLPKSSPIGLMFLLLEAH